MSTKREITQPVTKLKGIIKTWYSTLSNTEGATQWQYPWSPWGWEQAILHGMRSDHIAEATTFTQFCAWNQHISKFRTQLYQHWQAGKPQLPAPDLLDVSAGQARGFPSQDDPDISGLLCLVLAPETGLWWAPGPAGGQQQDSPKVLCSSWSQCSAKLISTKCSETKCSQRTRVVLASNISKYFQNIFKQQNYTKWNPKHWLPGLRLKSKAFLNNILCS